jgi:predicted nucleic acid-binding protein
VTALLDTSIFVASFWGDHPEHARSIRRYKSLPKHQAFCAAHTLAEVYSIMTRLPVKPAIPPDQALLFIEDIVQRYNIVALDPNEHIETIHDLAARGLARNLVYDALILRCARKAAVEQIFTWDIGDFKLIAPDLASRIDTP